MLYTVNRKPLVWIPMRDGIKLAAKLWVPELVEKTTDKSEEGEKYPAILGKKLYSELCLNPRSQGLSSSFGGKKRHPGNEVALSAELYRTSLNFQDLSPYFEDY